MIIEQFKLKECYIIIPSVMEDSRGYFFESFNREKFKSEVGHDVSFVQDNQSFSRYGVLRGLHFQKGAYAQSKLVRVLRGSVLDIAVDIRKDSHSFGSHISVELSSENKKQLFIPKGFAHGFVVLSKSAEVSYKVDNYYAPHSEGGLLFNDPDLEIDWLINKKDIILNNKDSKLPQLKNLFF